jgi:hypothetical protein
LEDRLAQELWTQVPAQSGDENAMLSDDQDAEVRTDNDGD